MGWLSAKEVQYLNNPEEFFLCGIVFNLLFLKRYQAIRTVVYKVFRLELSWVYLEGSLV
jgi:hypothetical protein